MKKLWRNVAVVVGLAIVLVAGFYTYSNKRDQEILRKQQTQINFITLAQQSGDYSYCDQAGNYKNRCIAETELEQTLKVDYNCWSPSACSQPQCLKGIECGSGGDGSGGCPAQEYCTVNPVWLCENTGGKSDVSIENAQSVMYGGSVLRKDFCSCSVGEVFINAYGCAKCDSFKNEETRSYCQANPQLQYFEKSHPTN